jgi:Alpha/beta hydrolase family
MSAYVPEWGQHLVLGLDEAGDGALVLLLPALSSISTRSEMRPLMERLASQFRVVAIDWPGFGTRSRPNVHWTLDALSIFLEHVLERVVDRPHGIMAAGHAASYVLDCASRRSAITFSLLQHGAGLCQRWWAENIRSLPKYGVRSRRQVSVRCSTA